MVSILKNNQPQQSQGQSPGNSQELKLKESANVVQHERSQAPTPDAARIRALLSVKTTEEVNRKQQNQDQGRAVRKVKEHAKHDKEPKIGGETVEEERQDQIAFRYVGNGKQNQATQVKSRRDPRASASVEIGEDLAPGVTKREGAELVISSQSSDTGFTNTYSNEADHHTEHESAQHSQAIGEELSHSPEQEVVKLLDLVGPEASLNFVERLREVWVMIDEGSLSDLDVTARMPANMLGQSGAELLAVESPQGIHFVAFLANSNDFEVLQTFDRHALLPGNPTKQLLEAAVVAYEQLGTLCRDGATRMEEKVQRLATDSDRNNQVFDQMRAQWIVAKRRSKKCGDLVEDFLEQIDDIEKQEAAALDEEERDFDPEEVIRELEEEERLEQEERIETEPEEDKPLLQIEDEDDYR